MRSTVYKATATTTGTGLLEPSPKEEEELPPHLHQPPPLRHNQIPVAAAATGPKARSIVPVAAAPGKQEDGDSGCCWGGLVPSPCPKGSTRQAGVGDAAGSSRPSKYQAVLPGHTADSHTGPGGAPASVSLPPLPSSISATVEPGQPPPPPAVAAVGSPVSSEASGKWKSASSSNNTGSGGGSSLRKSPMGAGGGNSSQAACLRQIMLLQLDLIEQQQQQLQAKEKEIEELKAERDTLLARIERMERRMQLVKKDEHEKCKIFEGYEREKVDPEVPEKLPIECPSQELLETSQLRPLKHFPYGRNGKGHKRKSVFGSAERKTPVKKLVAEFSKVNCKMPKVSALKEEPSSSLTESISRRELRSQETPEKTRLLVDTQLKSPTPLKGPVCHSKDKGSCSEIEDLPYLSTTEMYLCCWHQPPPSLLREPSPKKEETVAIPSWRDHTVEPLRDLNSSELLENLEDNVFCKRHAKLELDEKRRKRWDIQRIREQRILQRLQLRMYKKKGIQESEPEVASFFPESDDVESLLITPYLPVVAFGRPLPKLTPQNFELPWLDERSRCRLEMQKKQTPHRTCRK
ncbi:male-specific lethal 1 homolog [Protobothrops mucrosquamatus]|uniref:male-specific lethal 1 homolog n=1 Tax=Protobothrops mucrosquamatus TaxID=103944 RepID=UPI0010FB339A|nr:male-specific lethal 1 homolog [Protobothrops mucrosquamatus]